MNNLLFTSSQWDFDTIQRIYNACEEIAIKDLQLNTYPNQLEIINSEQMVDAYSSVGLPIMYNHWSFGKHFSQVWNLYQKNYQGLAYEIVINSSPCISYLMEQNSSLMQTLVIAHAAFGHNHFFKNNYLFKEWTDASSIISYLKFAKNYIAECERKYGYDAVSTFLDSCHALKNYGVDKYKRPKKIKKEEKELREKALEEYKHSQLDEFYKLYQTPEIIDTKDKQTVILPISEENILYFCEKNAVKLETWQRELIRIVRKIAEYFYPQIQTKVMNEGCATYVHYTILTKLHDQGKISDGDYLEFLQNHSNVVSQPSFKSKYYSGINPYKLGFEMFRDIQRICNNPTEEDKYWFSDICNQDFTQLFLHIVENYRDESFIRQFLSPKLIRELKLFKIDTNSNIDHFMVTNIHNEEGYLNIRESLANLYEIDNYIPRIEVTSYSKDTNTMYLTYYNYKNRNLNEVQEMIKHLKVLWTGNVVITDINNMSPTKNIETMGGMFYV